MCYQIFISNININSGCVFVFSAFAFGSVTLDGLHIATYFETRTTETCESEIFILVYVMHLLFTFVQTFFIFKNHKVILHTIY